MVRARACLQLAKAQGDFLLVGLHTDEDVTERRGPHLPIMNLHERSLSVLACKYVDEVVIGSPTQLTEDLIKTFNISLVSVGGWCAAGAVSCAALLDRGVLPSAVRQGSAVQAALTRARQVCRPRPWPVVDVGRVWHVGDERRDPTPAGAVGSWHAPGAGRQHARSWDLFRRWCGAPCRRRARMRTRAAARAAAAAAASRRRAAAAAETARRARTRRWAGSRFGGRSSTG